MANMRGFSKKSEYPSQTENRRQWILDTIRANQLRVIEIITLLWEGEIKVAKDVLGYMHKSDRDAILQPGGILTDEQIEVLK